MLDIFALFPWWVWALAVALLVLGGIGATVKPKKAVRLRHGKWGTVYVVRDPLRPDCVKVGFTTRLAKQRRKEIQRDMCEGRVLEEVFRITCPHARDVEYRAHQLLKSLKDDRGMGREWFYAKGGDPQEILIAVSRAVREVRDTSRVWDDRADTYVKVSFYQQPMAPQVILQGRPPS